ncbi:hypothetical protein D3C85_188070 [compost metagenome]
MVDVFRIRGSFAVGGMLGSSNMGVPQSRDMKSLRCKLQFVGYKAELRQGTEERNILKEATVDSIDLRASERASG